MRRPYLDSVWETFVRIGPCRRATFDAGRHVEVLRRYVIPAIEVLRIDRGWFHLMIHDDVTFGVGHSPRGDALWHLRLSLHPSVDFDQFCQSLPAQFESTRMLSIDSIQRIPGINASLVKSHDIADCWRLLGEQTEWLLKAVRAYREDADASAIARDLYQYAHLFENPILPQT